MKIEQYVYTYKENENASNFIQQTFNFYDTTNGRYGAYRIAIQALPGTQFTITGVDSQTLEAEVINSNLTGQTGLVMGHTGIYELGFAQPIIGSLKINKIIDEKSIIIIDALVNTGSTNASQASAMAAQDFDLIEGITGSNNSSLQNTVEGALWNE